MKSRLLLFGLCVLLLGAAPFRYSRELVAAPGWTVLELPDDVLGHARPGLPDIRITGPSGEIAYALERQLGSAGMKLSFSNVERSPNQETSALLDRGERPSPSTALELSIAGSESFLKPVILEASDDRKSFREIARGSIFRVPGVSVTTLRFAPDDRRYFRVRLDDRNGPPLELTAAHPLQPASAAAERVVTLELARMSREGSARDVYRVTLPARNLAVVALRFGVSDPAFSRRVSVYELLAFRDELTRRLVAEDTIQRGATGPESLLVSLGDISAASLEIELERTGPALGVQRVEAIVRPTRLLFFAPERGPLLLSYGSELSEPPAYDLVAALRKGLPATLAPASLGGEREAADAGRAIATPARGAKVDVQRWPRRQRIVLPAQTRVAYLDLASRLGRSLHQIRIVDDQGRQVPYLVESGERSERRALTVRAASEAGKTSITLGNVDPEETVRVLELRATTPEYWSRPVTVYEATKDKRGVTGRRVLGSASWTRRPNDTTDRLSIVLDQPTAQELVVEIDDGDNPALGLTAATLEIARHRIDFVFEPGDDLRLLSGNAEATAPRYDFALLADAVLNSPALAARLEAPETLTAAPPRRDTKWLWAAIVLAGALVMLVLARTLREQK